MSSASARRQHVTAPGAPGRRERRRAAVQPASHQGDL